MCQRLLNLSLGDILALKGGRISDYGGKSINLADDHSSIVINPSNARAKSLYEWYIKLVQTSGDEALGKIRYLTTPMLRNENADNLNIIENTLDKPKKN